LQTNSYKGGKVYIAGIEIPLNNPNLTYFKNIPVEFIAKPNLGYSFAGWENISTNDTVSLTFNKDIIIKALFTLDGYNY
tara:strand:+ start:260 stop:496 length:237 start_codon:yes stop_codon:yes gene_type:complete